MSTWHQELATRWARQRAIDDQKLTDREKVGDNLEQPRLVCHVAHFPDPESCNAAMGYFESHGFASRITTHAGRFVLSFERESALLRLEVDSLSRDIVLVVSTYGGRYSGWTATYILANSVAPPRSAPPKSQD